MYIISCCHPPGVRQVRYNPGELALSSLYFRCRYTIWTKPKMPLRSNKESSYDQCCAVASCGIFDLSKRSHAPIWVSRPSPWLSLRICCSHLLSVLIPSFFPHADKTGGGHSLIAVPATTLRSAGRASAGVSL